MKIGKLKQKKPEGRDTSDISNESVQKIVDYMESILEKEGISKSELEKDGAIYYANGRNGTEFDWAINDQIPRFGYGSADGERWVMTVSLDRYGDASALVYKDGGSQPTNTCFQAKLLSRKETKELKDMLVQLADNKGLYNETLRRLGFCYEEKEIEEEREI